GHERDLRGAIPNDVDRLVGLQVSADRREIESDAPSTPDNLEKSRVVRQHHRDAVAGLEPACLQELSYLVGAPVELAIAQNAPGLGDDAGGLIGHHFGHFAKLRHAIAPPAPYSLAEQHG